MKKLKFFGREISVLLIALVAVAGLASAALVGYLSNEVTGTVSIDSPLVLTVWDGNNYVSGPVNFGLVYGGSTISTIAAVKNNLDKVVESTDAAVVVKLTSSKGLVENEITKIRVTDGIGNEIATIPSTMYSVLGGELVLAFGLEVAALDTEYFPFELDVALNAHPDSVYTMEAQAMYIPELSPGTTIIHVNSAGVVTSVTTA